MQVIGNSRKFGICGKACWGNPLRKLNVTCQRFYFIISYHTNHSQYFSYISIYIFTSLPYEDPSHGQVFKLMK